jgi:hypothetical protein
MEVSESFFLLVIRASNVESSTSAAVRVKMEVVQLWVQVAKKVAHQVAALFIAHQGVVKLKEEGAALQ